MLSVVFSDQEIYAVIGKIIKQQLVIKDAFFVKLPPNVLVNGRVEQVGQLEEALVELKYKLGGIFNRYARQTYINIPDNLVKYGVVKKKIDSEYQNGCGEEKLSDVVALESDGIDDPIVSFYAFQNKGFEVRGHYVLTRNLFLLPYITALENAGFECVAAEPNFLAVGRAVNWSLFSDTALLYPFSGHYVVGAWNVYECQVAVQVIPKTLFSEEMFIPFFREMAEEKLSADSICKLKTLMVLDGSDHKLGSMSAFDGLSIEQADLSGKPYLKFDVMPAKNTAAAVAIGLLLRKMTNGLNHKEEAISEHTAHSGKFASQKVNSQGKIQSIKKSVLSLMRFINRFNRG